MSTLTNDLVIEINKGVIHEMLEKNPTAPESISVNQEELDKILQMVNAQEHMIMKASYLLGGISGHNRSVVVTKELQ